MEYEDRIVCFLDILGFKEYIKRTLVKDNIQRQNNIERIANVINFMICVTSPSDNISKHSTKRVTHFSDSIVISFLPSEKNGVFYTLFELLAIQKELVLNKILCRGGITRGKIIHTEKFLFGPAMVNAYILESKAALYPRIILDESIIKAAIKSFHEIEKINSLLNQDCDGMYYIDYITKAQFELDKSDDHPRYLKQLANIIEEGLKTTNPSIIIKYYWLKEKYNAYVKQLKNQYKDDKGYLSLPEF